MLGSFVLKIQLEGKNKAGTQRKSIQAKVNPFLAKCQDAIQILYTHRELKKAYTVKHHRSAVWNCQLILPVGERGW